MGMPLNSTGDDFGITYYSLEEKGVLSSDRGNARGFDKLYFFELPELKCLFEGSVRGERKTLLNQAKIHIVGDSGYYEKRPVRQDATYQFKIRQGEQYAVQASCTGYLSVAEYFTVPKQDQDYSNRKDFVLMPIAKTIRVDNIFFDFNQATLRSESKGALDYLIMLLTENPNITIELSSHTDIIGSEVYNLDLSNRRAKSVVDYLIDAGMSADRLTPKGYGKSVPVVVDDEIADQYPFLQYGDV
ncbi:MAG: OmpA family protein, partial [Bacteroidales bacterium]